jgi:hypothetical protein
MSQYGEIPHRLHALFDRCTNLPGIWIATTEGAGPDTEHHGCATLDEGVWTFAVYMDVCLFINPCGECDRYYKIPYQTAGNS